jgi:hypothetical protein
LRVDVIIYSYEIVSFFGNTEAGATSTYAISYIGRAEHRENQVQSV